MKLQQGATLVEIDKIKILPNRQRAPGFKTADLEQSISKLGSGRPNEGLLQPILINSNWELQFGERRLTACRKLGHTLILARFAESLSPIEAKIIELAENIKRQDIEWQDRVRGIWEIHQLFLAEDSEWTMTETGEEIGLDQSTVSQYLSVHSAMQDEAQPALQKRAAEASTITEAYNAIKRRDQRVAGAELQELLDAPDVAEVEDPEVGGLTAEQIDALFVPEEVKEGLRNAPPRLRLVSDPPAKTPPLAESILQTSFLDWAPKYRGEKFNLVHCDFPYGVNLGSGPQGRGAETQVYSDTPDIYWDLLACLCKNLDRFMSVSAHLMFWTGASTKNIEQTLAFFSREAPSLAFHRFPLIWVKSDGAGIASDPRMGPRHTYELCLLASRSSRQIVQVKADAYQSPSNRDLHPSTKPEPMLREFMRMVVDEGTALLDPTCGSGASLRAAESLGARRVLGLEINPGYVEPARAALKLSRAKQSASRETSGLAGL